VHEPVGVQAAAAHDALDDERAEVLALEALGLVLLAHALARQLAVLLLPRDTLGEHARARLAPPQALGRLLADGAHDEGRLGRGGRRGRRGGVLGRHGGGRGGRRGGRRRRDAVNALDRGEEVGEEGLEGQAGRRGDGRVAAGEVLQSIGASACMQDEKLRELGGTHLDHAKDAAVRAADAESRQAAQDRLALRIDLLLARHGDNGEVGDGCCVEDGEERGRARRGREEEEAQGLVVELGDAARGESWVSFLALGKRGLCRRPSA